MIRIATVLFSLLCFAEARAQPCRSFPVGPERRACVEKVHPDLFQRKWTHCRQLMTERGGFKGSAHESSAPKDFMQACMQGRQQ
jgi:hypothetical protein